MEKLDLIKGIMDAKKSENNTIDLGAYFEGLCDMYDKLMADNQLNSILEELNKYAEDIDRFEYGLPIYNLESLRQIIRDVII